MGYLLDSDVIISFLKQQEPGLHLMKEIVGGELSISVVSWAEIVYGIKKSKNPQKRLREFEEFLKKGRIAVLPLGRKETRFFVDLKISLEKKGEKLSDFDLLIAGTALGHKLTLVTGNVKHFARIKNLQLLTS